LTSLSSLKASPIRMKIKAKGFLSTAMPMGDSPPVEVVIDRATLGELPETYSEGRRSVFEMGQTAFCC